MVTLDGMHKGERALADRLVPLRWLFLPAVMVLTLTVSTAVAVASTSCPNESVRFGPSASLPDCRAYEQVTPVDKGDEIDLFARGSNGQTTENPDHGFPSDSGNEFMLVVKAGVNARNTDVYRRSSGGWNTTKVEPLKTGVQSVQPTVIDPSFGFSKLGVLDEVGSFTNAPAGGSFERLNLLGPPEGPFTTLSNEAVTQGTLENEHLQIDFPQLAGASQGFGQTVFETYDHKFAPGDEGQDSASRALYEIGAGHTRLVNVASDGSLISPCGAVLGQGTRESPGYAHNAVSRDGRRIVFTAPDPDGIGSGCWNRELANPPEIYVRVEESDGTFKTLDVSGEPEAGVSDPTLHPAVYMGASADGTKIFFMTETELTADDTFHVPQLYEYDLNAPEGKRLVRVSHGESGVAEGNVDFVPAVAGDEGFEGINVYFVAFGQLVAGLPVLAENQAYLYRYATGTGKTTYIATVGSREYPMTTNAEKTRIWYANTALPIEGERPHNELGGNNDANWYTTADGGYLVFASYQPITGYDNEPAGACVGDLTNYGEKENCAEVFRYSATDNTVVCVSCGTGVASNVDNAIFARSFLDMPDANGTPPRSVSEDGSYVFFETGNALVPQAQPGNEHVYEWHEGAVSLLSAADDPGNAFFLGATPSGHDVFIGTHAQLVPQDQDVSGDMYDARIDGGFPSIAPPVCTGTGCQGAPTAPPAFATPASLTFEGVGNFGPSHKKPPAPQSKAKRLAKALKACRRDRDKRARRRCERRARQRYGRKHKATKANRRGK